MAAPAVVRSSGPALCPSFAVVCSFLERYGAALDLPEMTFPQMERYLRDKTAGEKKWWKAATLETRGEGKGGTATSTTIFIIFFIIVMRRRRRMMKSVCVWPG
eukprot:superscaffoldBa00008440_g23353